MLRTTVRVLGLGGLGLGAYVGSTANQLGPRHDNELSLFSPGAKKKAIIVGGGVAGVSSAYQLRRKGYDVVILDSDSEVGNQCSAAAAGGMQRLNPRVDRNLWKKTLASLVPSFDGSHKYFHIDWLKAAGDPHFLRWLYSFTKYSLFYGEDGQSYRQQQMLNFTDLAIDSMMDYIHKNRLEKGSGLHETGAMRLIYGKEEFEKVKGNYAASGEVAPKDAGQWKGREVIFAGKEPSVLLNRQEVLQLESWLAKSPTGAGIQGAEFQYKAAFGNCQALTRALAHEMKQQKKGPSVKFMFQTSVVGIDGDVHSHIRALHIVHDGEKRRIDVSDDTAVVVAAGSWSPLILRYLGLYTPLYPMKGYNLIINLKKHPFSSEKIPGRIVNTDLVYTTSMLDQVRIASMGEFAGFSSVPTPEVSQELRAIAKSFAPEYLHKAVDESPVVMGMRPFVADGALLIGKVGVYRNLFVNCGPGFNGWKVALGAGELLARSVNNDDVSPSTLGYDPSVLDPEGRIVHSPYFVRLCQVVGPSTE